MKIVDNRNKSERFGNIDVGSVFDYDGYTLIKAFFDGKPYGVSLSDGVIVKVKLEDFVKVLDCTLTINK